MITYCHICLRRIRLAQPVDEKTVTVCGDTCLSKEQDLRNRYPRDPRDNYVTGGDHFLTSRKDG